MNDNIILIIFTENLRTRSVKWLYSLMLMFNDTLLFLHYTKKGI